MTLEERIAQDLKEAMKNKDEAAKRGLRAIKQAILLQKTSGSGEALNPDLEIKMLQKLVKQRRESLEIYEKQGREDLAQVEREEIAVIERYLPEQLGEAELKAELEKIVQEVGADSMKDMGKVMGIATQRLAGRAEGKAISQVVRQILS
jgi:hypothetical protein